MEIGGVNIAPMQPGLSGSGSSEKVASQGGFAGVLQQMLGTVQTGLPVNVSASGQSQQGDLPVQVAGLLQFLGTVDILELEEGIKLDELPREGAGEEELLAFIQNFLGMTPEQWDQMVKKVSEQLGIEENSSLKDIQPLQQEPDGKAPAGLAALVEAMTKLSELVPAELGRVLGKEVGVLIKAAKLIELVSSKEDGTPEEAQLVKLVKSVTENLEASIATGKKTERHEFLQTVFTRLATDLNQNSKKVFPGVTILKESDSKADTIVEKGTGGNGFIQLMSRHEQLSVMLGDSKQPVQSSKLIEQFEAILARAKFTGSGAMKSLTIKLNPEHLGQLRIELQQRDQSMMARIFTSSTVAKDVLESQLHGLKQAFTNQNLQIDRIEVSQQQTSQERFPNRDQQQGGHNRGENNLEEEQKLENDQFILSLDEALLNMEA